MLHDLHHELKIPDFVYVLTCILLIIAKRVLFWDVPSFVSYMYCSIRE